VSKRLEGCGPGNGHGGLMVLPAMRSIVRRRRSRATVDEDGHNSFAVPL